MLGALAASVFENVAIAGPLEGSTHMGTQGEPGEGAYVRIWLKIGDGRIEKASYMTHGCPSSQAASAATVSLATGRTLEQAALITAKDIDLLLGGLPDGRGHFADMAPDAPGLAPILQDPSGPQYLAPPPTVERQFSLWVYLTAENPAACDPVSVGATFQQDIGWLSSPRGQEPDPFSP